MEQSTSWGCEFGGFEFSLLKNYSKKMRTSVKVKLGNPNKEGDSKIYLQCFVNGKKVMLSTEVLITAAMFNSKDQLSPIRKTHPQANDLNMLVRAKLNMVNEIFTMYRLNRDVLTADKLREEIQAPDRRHDFLAFVRAEIDFQTGVRHKKTVQHYKVLYRRLQRFQTHIAFSDLNYDFIEQFAIWMRKEENLNRNTVIGNLRKFRAFVTAAKRKLNVKINQGVFDYPIGNYVETQRQPLNDSEVKALLSAYRNGSLKNHKWNLQKVAQYFLFACFTGVRISDIQRITPENIQGGKLVFKPYKTRNLDKVVKVPLTPIALELIEGQMDNELLFDCVADQATNRYLKEIAKIAGIEKNLTFHIARFTFAVLIYQNAKDILLVKRLLGHADIKTTMRYLKGFMYEKDAEQVEQALTAFAA